MKTNKLVTVWFISFMCATFCCIVSLFAADAPAAATAGDFATPKFFVSVGTPLLTLLIAAFVTKWKPKLGLPLLAAIVTTLGTVSSAIASVVLSVGPASAGTVAKSAALALSGVAVKVLLDKLNEKPAQ